jgi:hypothetical protein
MVLTKSELISGLQNEVRILLHLMAKVDPSMLDYRPTPKQRSTMELLRYLSMMGPMLLTYALAKDGTFDGTAWTAEAAAANRRTFDETRAAIAAHDERYAAMLRDVPETVFREEIQRNGQTMSRGAFIVSLVLSGCAAYRTQLFLYLKACGHEELGTANLWRGVDAPVAVA